MKTIGKISGTKGLDGELKVRLFYDVVLKEGDSLMLEEVKGSYIPYIIEYILDTTKDGMTKLLKLEGIDDRNQGLQVSKKELQVDDDFFDERLPEGSYYRMIGYTLWNGNTEVGSVTDIIEMAQIILVIGNEKEGVFVPFVEDWLEEKNDDDQMLVMNLPEGLLEMNQEGNK